MQKEQYLIQAAVNFDSTASCFCGTLDFTCNGVFSSIMMIVTMMSTGVFSSIMMILTMIATGVHTFG